MNITERKKLRKDKPGVWVPVETGDRIVGTVVEVTAAWSDVQYKDNDPDSGFYPLLRVQATEATGYPDPGVLAVHAFAAVLQSRILEQEPVPGEDVIITYEGTGEAKTRGRNAPELYRLELPGRSGEDLANRAYAQLRGKRRGAGPAPAPAPEPDVPIDTEGIGF